MKWEQHPISPSRVRLLADDARWCYAFIWRQDSQYTPAADDSDKPYARMWSNTKSANYKGFNSHFVPVEWPEGATVDEMKRYLEVLVRMDEDSWPSGGIR